MGVTILLSLPLTSLACCQDTRSDDCFASEIDGNVWLDTKRKGSEAAVVSRSGCHNDLSVGVLIVLED